MQSAHSKRLRLIIGRLNVSISPQEMAFAAYIAGMKHAARFGAAVAITCLAMLGSRAEACMVCIPFPEDTATDQLLRADVVVLARENPDKPFSYVAVEVLKGELADPRIDLFLNSRTRRRLSLDPDESVVLTFAGGSNEWRSAGYATRAFSALAGAILARESTFKQWGWEENRANFFIPYLADADRSVRELAYLEVGRASYDTIRRADAYVPPALVHGFLADPQYLEWHALYILLLGVNATADEKRVIRAELANRARFNRTLNLGAWATALIEIDGTAAIDWLETVYLAVPERDPEVVLEIVKALSVQGARKRSALRPRIAESYARLIRAHPSLAGQVARDLSAWRDWRLVDALTEMRRDRSNMDAATAYAIDIYIGGAPPGD